MASKSESNLAYQAVADAWLTQQLSRPVFRLKAAQGHKLQIDTFAPGSFLYAKLPIELAAEAAALRSLGFMHVETSGLFEKRALIQAQAPKARVECFTPAQAVLCAGLREQVVSIARSAFVWSRFHQDHRFPKELADQVKAAWIENFFVGLRGSKLLVAFDRELPVGFISMIAGPDTKTRIDLIDLVAVRPTYQGRGVGSAMLDAVEWFSKDAVAVQVGTQLANQASVALYRSRGYELLSTADVFHLHVGLESLCVG
jgi:ribosomal protein S18 acetylase RimI-like enzyme